VLLDMSLTTAGTREYTIQEIFPGSPDHNLFTTCADTTLGDDIELEIDFTPQTSLTLLLHHNSSAWPGNLGFTTTYYCGTTSDGCQVHFESLFVAHL